MAMSMKRTVVKTTTKGKGLNSDISKMKKDTMKTMKKFSSTLPEKTKYKKKTAY